MSWICLYPRIKHRYERLSSVWRAKQKQTFLNRVQIRVSFDCNELTGDKVTRSLTPFFFLLHTSSLYSHFLLLFQFFVTLFLLFVHPFGFSFSVIWKKKETHNFFFSIIVAFEKHRSGLILFHSRMCIFYSFRSLLLVRSFRSGLVWSLCN